MASHYGFVCRFNRHLQPNKQTEKEAKKKLAVLMMICMTVITHIHIRLPYYIFKRSNMWLWHLRCPANLCFLCTCSADEKGEKKGEEEEEAARVRLRQECCFRHRTALKDSRLFTLPNSTLREIKVLLEQSSYITSVDDVPKQNKKRGCQMQGRLPTSTAGGKHIGSHERSSTSFTQ